METLQFAKYLATAGIYVEQINVPPRNRDLIYIDIGFFVFLPLDDIPTMLPVLYERWKEVYPNEIAKYRKEVEAPFWEFKGPHIVERMPSGATRQWFRRGVDAPYTLQEWTKKFYPEVYASIFTTNAG